MRTLLILLAILSHASFSAHAQSATKFIERTRVESALFITTLKEVEIHKALTQYSKGLTGQPFLGTALKDSVAVATKRKEFKAVARTTPVAPKGMVSVPKPSVLLTFTVRLDYVDGEAKLSFKDFETREFAFLNPDGSVAQIDETKYPIVYNTEGLSAEQHFQKLDNMIARREGAYLPSEVLYGGSGKASQQFEAAYLMVNEKWWADVAMPTIRNEFKRLATLIQGSITATATNGEVTFKNQDGKLLPVDERERKKWVKKGVEF